MLSVRAIFDGKNLKLLENVDISEPKEVIVTFLESTEEDISTKEIMSAAQNSGAFDFLNNEEDDIYSDEDLKVRYK